jgi:molecular chaperone DnaK (HSP70)
MLADAEKFKEEDECLREQIEERNSYESLVFQFKSTLNDEKTSQAISEELKTELLKTLDEHATWLENNQGATKEE